jgi:hypothetical protein
MTTKHADTFLDPADDPREGGTSLGDERATLVEFLRCHRLTLEIKCSGLDAEQLARRSVEPSTMSLLGLVRHLAEVERSWMRRTMSALDAPRLYKTEVGVPIRVAGPPTAGPSALTITLASPHA